MFNRVNSGDAETMLRTITGPHVWLCTDVRVHHTACCNNRGSPCNCTDAALPVRGM